MNRLTSMVSGLVLAAAVGLAMAEEQPPFRIVLRKPGDDGSQAYRIPGLATTPQGTLLAVFDIRHDSADDLPANIDVGLLRSTDGGTNWGPMQTILDFDQSVPGARGNGVGDPAILVDRTTGTVWVAALWSQGDRGYNGSGPGLSPAETGQIVLTRSTDDGRTWSAPINITARIDGREPSWRLLFVGPGNGIQTRDGRLVFAAQFRDAEGDASSCLLFSRDHGRSWALTPAAIRDGTPTNEAQVAELADGSLLLTMRDVSRGGVRLWARWTWAEDGATGEWSAPWGVNPDPTCMASLIAHSGGDLFFSNPASRTQRRNLTIRHSADGGRTWNAGRLIDPGPSAYSCLTELAGGQLGLLYEAGDTLTFLRCSADWVRGAGSRAAE